MAKSLKPGAIFVTFTKGLNLPKHFEVLERKRYKMSWGPATVFIHRRLGPDGKPIGPFRLNILPSDDKSYSDDEDDDKRKFLSNDSEDEDDEDDEDDYEDEFESEDDGEIGNEEDEDTSADEDDDDDGDDSESSEDYGLGNEQQMNSYAPQRSYYATSSSRTTPPQPSPQNDSYGATLQVKVNPLKSKPFLPYLLTLLRSTKCWCLTTWSWKSSRCCSLKKKESLS